MSTQRLCSGRVSQRRECLGALLSWPSLCEENGSDAYIARGNFRPGNKTLQPPHTPVPSLLLQDKLCPLFLHHMVGACPVVATSIDCNLSFATKSRKISTTEKASRLPEKDDTLLYLQQQNSAQKYLCSFMDSRTVMFVPWEREGGNTPQRLMGTTTVHLSSGMDCALHCLNGSQTSTGAACTQSWRHKRREKAQRLVGTGTKPKC